MEQNEMKPNAIANCENIGEAILNHLSGGQKFLCAPHLNSKRILQTEDYFILGRVLYLHERLKTLSSPLSFTKKFLCAANMSVLSALDPRITSNTPQLPVLSQRKPQEKKITKQK